MSSPVEANQTEGQPIKAENAAPAGGSTLADRIGMVVGGQFVSAAIGLIQGILVVRLLPKSAYGTLALILMLYGTGRDLGTFYIPESILYFASKVNRSQLVGLVRQSMALLFGLGVIVALVLASLSLQPDVFLSGHRDLTHLLLIAGLVCIVGFPGTVYGNTFIATDNHRRAAGIALLMTVLGALSAVVPAALGWPIAVILGAMVVNLLLRLALSEQLFRAIFSGAGRAPFPGGIRAQMNYAVPLMITRFAGIFNQKLDKFVVGLFFSADAFAEFAIASQELPLVSILPYAIASTMTPKLVERYEQGASRLAGAQSAVSLWHAGIRKAAIVMVPVGIFLLVAAEPLITVLYGQKYQGAAAPFRIYSALLPLRVTGYGTMLIVFGRTREIMAIQIGGMALHVAANFLLLPRIGMVAAPLSAALTQAAMIVALLARIHSVARTGLRGLFPFSHYGRVLLASVIAVVPVIVVFLVAASLPPAVLLGLSIPVYTATYVAVAWALNALAEEDRAYVLRWLRLEPLRRHRSD